MCVLKVRKGSGVRGTAPRLVRKLKENTGGLKAVQQVELQCPLSFDGVFCQLSLWRFPGILCGKSESCVGSGSFAHRLRAATSHSHILKLGFKLDQDIMLSRKDDIATSIKTM